jgi:carboxylesterase type B
MQRIPTKDFLPWTYEYMTHNEVNEDCLYLNVWTGAKSAMEKRPVYMYIYGGGFSGGSAEVPIYDGEGLASKGLVVVTINYRLGILGFFAHPELSKESSHNVSGNYGLLDMIAALKWIHDNIAAFGGDPNRVTIAGQSAGSIAVHDLVTSPLARGLFQRAIAESAGSTVGQSGLGNGGAAPSLATAEAGGVRFGEEKGAKSIADLRAMSWEELVAPPPGAAGGDGAPGPHGARRSAAPPAMRGRGPAGSPVIDGYVLPMSPNEAIARGKYNDVPFLTGNNTGELAGLVNPRDPVTLESFRNQAKQRYGDDADKFLALYPASTDTEAVAAQIQANRDLTMVGLYLWAAMRSKTSKNKTFDYLYDHVMPGPESAWLGAFHTSEVPYVMNTLYEAPRRPFADVDHKIADMMSSCWVNFATNGDPNGKGLPLWPSYSGSATIMELGDKNEAVPAAGDEAKLAFFKAYLTRP